MQSGMELASDSCHSAAAGESKAAWTQALCTAMADAQLSSSKTLARHALQALWGSHSAYRDAKAGLALQQQSQACTLAAPGLNSSQSSGFCSWILVAGMPTFS